jgi:hypothetical protein
MMIDADKDHGNRPRTGRRERAATPGAHWSRHLAAHVPRVKASQLSAIFLRATCFTGWHVDAANRDELVRL